MRTNVVMKMTLPIKLEMSVPSGLHITKAVDKAISYRKERNVALVGFSVNGIELQVGQNSKPKNVVAEYFRLKTKRGDYKCQT